MKPIQLLIILLLLPFCGFTQSVWDYDSLPKRNPNDLGFLGFSKHITDYRVESYINSKKTVKSITVKKDFPVGQREKVFNIYNREYEEVVKEIVVFLFNSEGWIQEKTTILEIKSADTIRKEKLKTIYTYEIDSSKFFFSSAFMYVVKENHSLYRDTNRLNENLLIYFRSKEFYSETTYYFYRRGGYLREQESFLQKTAYNYDHQGRLKKEFFESHTSTCGTHSESKISYQYSEDTLTKDTTVVSIKQLTILGSVYDGDWNGEPQKDTSYHYFYKHKGKQVYKISDSAWYGKEKQLIFPTHSEIYRREGYKVKYEYY